MEDGKMNKAKLIKKDSPMQEEIKQARKARKLRRKHPTSARNAFDMTTEWLKTKKEETPSARKAFASLFTNTDPQSA
ncbi:MAG: hypothetical protein IPM55_20945 [Acidobacteria bacterium]|nr:hypothetical protein [Acidobacteriota bacterium]